MYKRQFYRRVFEKIKEKGIHLLVNLYHFDLPMALQEQGDGWENKETAYAYQEYARFCFKTYGCLLYTSLISLIKKASVGRTLPRLFNMLKTIVEYLDDFPNQLDCSFL